MKLLLCLVAIVGVLSVVSADPSQCIGNCPEQEGDDVYLLPHENCTAYCSCSHGKPIELSCPENLHWSPKDRVCTYPWQAKCATEGDTPVFLRSLDLAESIDGREYLCIGTCPANDIPDVVVTLEHQECGKFCKCVKGYGQERECPIGFHFSPHLGVCTYPHVAQCFRVTTTQAPPTTPHDCCPCPTTWTPWTNTPTKPTTTPLPTKPTTTPPPTKPTTTPPPTKPTTTPPPTKPTTTPPPTQPTTTPAPTKPTTVPTTTTNSGYDRECIGKCPSKDPPLTVHLPHTHCSKFCKCSNGIPYVFQCQPGLYFNPKLQVCDVPVQAGCKGIKD